MKSHYRYIIIACCFLVLFVNQGLCATSFNVYQTYLVELPGVGDLGASFIITLRTFVSLLVMIFVAAFYRRIDPRYGIFIATLCSAAGFLAYGLAGDSLVVYCVGAILAGIGYGLGGMVAATIVLGAWFKGSLGTAAGIIGTGSGVAAMVIPVAAAEIIAAAGLSTAFLWEAALAGAIALTLFLCLRAKPEQMGLVPYEGKVEKPSASRAPEGGRRKPIAKSVLPKADKRLMVVAMALAGAVAITGSSYFSVLLTSSGVTAIAAAGLTALCGAALTFGKLACGWTFDRLGTRTGTVIFFMLLLAGLALCAAIGWGGTVDGALAAVAFGIGISVAPTGMTIWSLELSHPRTMMKNVRDLNLAYATGAFLFNMMPGVLKTLTGTYAATYGVLAACALVSGTIVVLVYTRRTRSIREEGR